MHRRSHRRSAIGDIGAAPRLFDHAPVERQDALRSARRSGGPRAEQSDIFEDKRCTRSSVRREFDNFDPRWAEVITAISAPPWWSAGGSPTSPAYCLTAGQSPSTLGTWFMRASPRSSSTPSWHSRAPRLSQWSADQAAFDLSVQVASSMPSSAQAQATYCWTLAVAQGLRSPDAPLCWSASSPQFAAKQCVSLPSDE